jgi:hypothetical protein
VQFHRRQVLAGATALMMASLLGAKSGLAQGQQGPSSRQLPSVPAIAVDENSGEKQQMSGDSGSSNKKASSGCSLTVSNTLAAANGAMVSSGSSDYSALSGRCKFHLFVKQTYSPYTFASAGFEATWDDATGRWPHYGEGAQGWAKRFGATLADTESRRFIQSFALSTILHQDPRYFPSGKKTLIPRALYALTRVAITKNDDGREAFNSSEFLGALFTSALENSYYPRSDRSLGDTLSRFEGALSSDATSYLLREFTPDLKRLFRRHAPKRIQRIEKKLPIPADDKL